MKCKKTDDFLSRLPSKLVEKLMNFQKEGVEFAINKNGRCLIADEMGLGKTLQAICIAYYYRSEWPLLIIVPSSLRYAWIEEFEKWLPDINPSEINLIQTGNDASCIGTASVTITTFGLLSKSTSNIVREALISQGFQVVIVDESHYIRNIKTVSSKVVVPLIKNANRRLLLSGTPALARPVELYPQIDAICPNSFGSWWSYTSRYCDAKIEWIGKIKKRSVNGASNLEELQQRLSATLMIRREKSQVLTQLPPKQRQRVLFELKDSELKKEIRQTFEELSPLLKNSRTDRFEVLSGAADHDTKDTNSLSLIQRLYQLSGEAKIGPAKEYVEMLCENPRLKFLVFAYHHAMMNGLTQSLYDKHVKFIRIDGETPQSERPHLVRQFQSDPDTRVAILSILAAGVGLTLTAASLVVFAEMYWTPGMMVQCEDRAHRIGQTNCVSVHYLVAKDTMDEWVWSAVCKKTVVTSTALTGRKQEMKADAGEKYQVDVLSNADAWVPTENEDVDLANFFETQQETDQKSILDFFTPSRGGHRKLVQSSKTATPTDDTPGRQSHHGDTPHPCAKKPRLDSTLAGINCNIESENIKKVSGKTSVEQQPSKQKGTTPKKNIILIDSESDEGDFALTKRSKSRLCSTSRSGGKISSKRKRKEKSKKQQSTPKHNLTTMFAKSRRNTGCTAESIVLSDSDIDVSDNLHTSVSMTQVDMADSESETPDHKGNKKSDIATVGTEMLDNVSFSSNNEVKQTDETQDKLGKQGRTSPEDNIVSWKCSACTFSNRSELGFCEICETPNKQASLRRKIRPSKSRKSVIDTCNILSTKCAKDVDCSNSETNKVSESQHMEDDVNVSLALKEIDEFEKLKELSESFIGSTKKKRNSHQTSSKENIDPDADFVDAPKDGSLIESAEHPNNVLVVKEVYAHIPQEESKPFARLNNNSNNTDFTQNSAALDESRNAGIDCVDHVHDSIGREDKSGNGDEDPDIAVYSSPVAVTDREESVVSMETCTQNSEEISGYSEQMMENSEVSDSISAPVEQRIVSSEATSSQASVSTTCDTPQTTFIPKQYRFKSVSKQSSLANLSPFQTPNDNKTCTGITATQLQTSPLSPFKNGTKKFESEKETGNDHEPPVDAKIAETSDITPARNMKDRNVIYEDYSFSSPEIEEYFSDSMVDAASDQERTKGSKRDRSTNSENGPDKKSVSKVVGNPAANDTESSMKHSPEKRVVNIDDIPAYSKLWFQCSKYTGRVYVFSQEDSPLNVNFVPMDVQVDNTDELPDILLHPSNLRLVQKFVREWQSLTETKRRLIIKNGRTFVSPLREYEDLRSCKTVNTQRHKTKDDTALAARKKATEVNGTVRVISRRSGVKGQSTDQSESRADGDVGVTQAVAEDGTPLCLQCFSPYENHLLHKTAITSEDNAWKTRFCSQRCSQEYWMKTNNDYCRDKVYEAEHGICQMCGFDAHALYKQTRDTQDLQRRAELIARSKLSCLNPRTKQLMVKKPAAGQFWHVDHITPVWEGGGQCDIDNLRTLCIPCHHKITAKQASKRATVRKLGSAVGQGDITAFFQRS